MNVNDLVTHPRLESVKRRFEFNVYRSPSCWIWTGGVHDSRYEAGKRGWFSVDRRKFLASRVSWCIYRGPIKGKLHVLHKCDNPMCVNPDHLFLGTHKDNMRDMASKLRNPMRKLTIEQVRYLRASRLSDEALGAELGVLPQTIRRARDRFTWDWLD